MAPPRKRQKVAEDSLHCDEELSDDFGEQIGFCKKFRLPSQQEKLEALGSKRDFKKFAAMPVFSDKDLQNPSFNFFSSIPEPTHQDDWLAQYAEEPQPFTEWLSLWKDLEKPAHSEKNRHVIYLQPIGDFNSSSSSTSSRKLKAQPLRRDYKSPDLLALLNFVQAYYYGAEVRLLPSLPVTEEIASKGRSCKKSTHPNLSVSVPDNYGTEWHTTTGHQRCTSRSSSSSSSSRRLSRPTEWRLSTRQCHPYDLEKTRDGERQVQVDSLLSMLHSLLPDDAFCMVGITMEDLFDSKRDSFVVGMAAGGDRIGIFSFARYALLSLDDAIDEDIKSLLKPLGVDSTLAVSSTEPEDSLNSEPVRSIGKRKRTLEKKPTKQSQRKQWIAELLSQNSLEDVLSRIFLKRCGKVLVHEIGHIYGLDHCIYYSCCMNGSGHLKEDFAQPLHLCPVDLRKLSYVFNNDLFVRYQQLLRFYQEQRWWQESHWVEMRLKMLQEPAQL